MYIPVYDICGVFAREDEPLLHFTAPEGEDDGLAVHAAFAVREDSLCGGQMLLGGGDHGGVMGQPEMLHAGGCSQCRSLREGGVTVKAGLVRVGVIGVSGVHDEKVCTPRGVEDGFAGRGMKIM